MASPVDSPPLRPQYMRALSTVPVRRRPDSSAPSQSPSISWPPLAHEAHQEFDAEAARGILYAVYQVHLGVQTLMGLTRGERNDGVTQGDSCGGGNTGGPWHRRRRSRLEMIFHNANVYLEELEQAIQAYDDDGCHDHDRLASAKKDPTSTLVSAAANSARTPRPSGMDHRQHPHAHYEHGERIRMAYATLIGAYTHTCAELVGSVDLLLDNGDPRYVRTFMMMLFHSVMELRATMATWLQPRISTVAASAAAATATSELGSSNNNTSNSNSNSVALRNGQQNPTPTTIAGSGNGGGSGMKRSTTRQSPPPPLFKTRVGSTGSSDGSSNYVVARAVGGPSLPLGLSIASSLRPESSYLPVAAKTPRSAGSFTSAISSSSSSDGGGGCGPRCEGESGRRAFVSHRLLPAVHHVSGLISSIVPSLSEAFAVGARCAAVAGSGGGGSNGSGGSSGSRSINLQQRNRAAAASAIKWQRLAACATALLQQAELLSAHLASDSNNVDALLVPSSPLWSQCNGLAGAWAELGDAIKTALQQTRQQQRGGRVEDGGSAYVNAAAAAEMQLGLPLDALDGLRGISRAMKELVAAMVAAREAEYGGVLPAGFGKIPAEGIMTAAGEGGVTSPGMG